jgi:TM2 domain-containing membrane protein YozV
MPAVSVSASSSKPARSPITTIILAWLVPGSGHFLLGRRGRGVIVFFTVLLSFVTGLLMRGPFFQLASNGDLLSRLIQYGGFLGDLATGLFYLLSVWLGYGPPDQAGHTPDYGSKFIVAAGLLNILAMVDAYEIATRQKD